MNTVIAGMVSSIAVVIAITPFDVVATRLYNQGERHMYNIIQSSME